MMEFLLNWVLSATAVVAVVLLLRAVFGKRIGARLRYALWLVALARLLVPAQLYTAPVEAPRVLPEVPAIQALPGVQGPAADRDGHSPGTGPVAPAQANPGNVGDAAADDPEARKPFGWAAALGWAWLLGSVALAGAFAVSNVGFYRRLRRVRVPLDGTACSLKVYMAPGLPSPCLFGVLRPAVYVSPEAAADLTALSHVLAHEATHCRHGDHIWSLLRCAALAVHWWNPLVWLAAALSRRDAELACDEGALLRLGDGQRRAYGETLLALVTAKPKPGELLCCATTMSGDKRSLQERISRIARAPKRWLWAAVLAAALSALVCACAFARTETVKPDGPLTEEELAFFHQDFFNGDGFNIRNQFVYLAVEAPKDYRQIDLYQLFYNGTGDFLEVTEEERQAVVERGYGGEDPMVDLVKCPAARMDEILQENLGLSLEETDKWGLGQFVYLEEYDAYYTFHGDTNYLGEIAFSYGERKDGKVLLYYEGEGCPVLSNGDGSVAFWEGTRTSCLTLEEQKDGSYHFLSNWRVDTPAVPTAYPDWEPELVVPLDGLEPYRAPAVLVERHTGDVAEVEYAFRFEPDEFSDDGFDVEVYRSTDGNTYAAVAVSENERDCFLTVPTDGGVPVTNFAGAFTDLFGFNGVAVSYYGWLDERYYGEFNDYYTFSDGGAPSLLLRAKGEPVVLDLDGDGVKELAASGGDAPQLFFQRDGQIYEAEVQSLVQAAWPEAGYTEYGWWNTDSRYLPVSAQVDVPGSETMTATAFRTLWFDGENLRLYKDGGAYADHVKQDIDAPAEVLGAARDFVQEQYEYQLAEGHGFDGNGGFSGGRADWDDWHITGLSGPYYEAAGPLQIEIWNLSYELHTTTPDRVVLAGGSYMGEDGWCMIGYPGCDYLYFLVGNGGSRTYLFAKMENDCAPGTELFLSDMVNALTGKGYLKLSEMTGQSLAKVMWPQSASFLNRLAEGDGLEREKVLSLLGEYLAQEGAEEYENFAGELNPGGFRDGELTAGGRAAWERIQSIADSLAG